MAATYPDSPWERFEPNARQPWTVVWAGHLFRRAGFGPNWPELQQSFADGPQKTIDRLLASDAAAEAYAKSADANEAGAARSDGSTLRAWWLRRMIETPRPLVEKMTLFWHGHFAVSATGVQDPAVTLSYLRLLRREALGRFDRLLAAIVNEPAVLVGLDSTSNRLGATHKHLAAALLGPFTTGQASENDLAEAARALTGQTVRREEYKYLERDHDPGVKTIFGQSGKWGPADVARLALAQPATARRIVEKMYRWLISETEPPGEALLQPLVESFRKDYDIGKLVETMLRSRLFFSEAALRQRVKCPVEFVVGLIRAFESVVPTLPLAEAVSGLGQNLFYPPTMHGWEGGQAWLTRATYLGRIRLALTLFAGKAPYEEPLNPKALAANHGRTNPAEIKKFFGELLLQSEAAHDDIPALPEFQLA